MATDTPGSLWPKGDVINGFGGCRQLLMPMGPYTESPGCFYRFLHRILSALSGVTYRTSLWDSKTGAGSKVSKPCHLRTLWSNERPGLQKNRACDPGKGTKLTGASPIQGSESFVKTKPRSTESQECLPTTSGEATHHHSCESVVGCVGYRCHRACSQPLGLSEGIKGREERGQETPKVPELHWNTPGDKAWLSVYRVMPQGYGVGGVLFLSMRGTNQAGTGASGSKYKIT